jgi:hypothetical protein
MPIKLLNLQGHNSTSKLYPKPGRLATSTYQSWGARRIGPTEALGVHPPAPQPLNIPFGDIGRASVATQHGNRVDTNGPMPLGSNFNVNTIPKKPARMKHGQAGKPYPVGNVPLIMPHERPVIGAHNYRNLSKRQVFKTQFGAGKTMSSDTAFHRKPQDREMKQPAKSAVEAVHVPKKAQPSFMSSKSNLWYDPNNSYTVNQPTVSDSQHAIGVGRWHTIKRGAAG